MTEPGAAEMTVRQSPRVGLEALRNLRRLLDATSPSPDDRASIDRRDIDEKDAGSSAEPIRCAGDSDRDEGTAKHSDGAAQTAGAGTAHRTRRRTKTGSGGPRAKD